MVTPIALGRLIYHSNLYREQIMKTKELPINSTQTLSPTNFNWLNMLAISNTNQFHNIVFYAILLSILISFNVIVSHPHFMANFRLGLRVRVALTKLIYEKSLRIRTSSIERMTRGKIVNLISTDASRLDSFYTAFYFAYCAIIHCIVALIFLYYYIGM